MNLQMQVKEWEGQDMMCQQTENLDPTRIPPWQSRTGELKNR